MIIIIIIIIIYCIDLRFIIYKMPLTQTNSNTGLWEAFCKTSNVAGIIILLLLLTEYQNEEYSWRLREVWSSNIETGCGKLEISQIKGRDDNSLQSTLQDYGRMRCDAVLICQMCVNILVSTRPINYHFTFAFKWNPTSPRTHLFRPVLEAPRKLHVPIVPVCTTLNISAFKDYLCYFKLT